MSRFTCFLLLTCASVFSPQLLYGQQLKDLGMMATGVLSRTRAGGDDFQLGDMMYVTAIHPANSGGMYVSAHMEYLDNSGNWQPVPTAQTALGNEYKSGKYPGMRDFVRFEECAVNSTRHICLFMPYEAASLPIDRFYERRYVLRVWDKNNHPIAHLALAPDAISTRRDSEGKFIMVTVKAKACASMVDASTKQPIPESEDEGTVRFFNATTGIFVCPGRE